MIVFLFHQMSWKIATFKFLHEIGQMLTSLNNWSDAIQLQTALAMFYSLLFGLVYTKSPTTLAMFYSLLFDLVYTKRVQLHSRCFTAFYLT